MLPKLPLKKKIAQIHSQIAPLICITESNYTKTSNNTTANLTVENQDVTTSPSKKRNGNVFVELTESIDETVTFLVLLMLFFDLGSN